MLYIKKICKKLLCSSLVFAMLAEGGLVYRVSAEDTKITFDNLLSVPFTVSVGGEYNISGITLENGENPDGTDGKYLCVGGRTELNNNIFFSKAFKDMEQGEKYTISMCVKASERSNVKTGSFYTAIVNASNKIIYNSKDAEAKCTQTVTDEGWTQISMDYTFEKEEASGIIIAQSASNADDLVDELYIDDVSVTKGSSASSAELEDYTKYGVTKPQEDEYKNKCETLKNLDIFDFLTLENSDIITRAEMTDIIINLLNIDATTGKFTAGFSDVGENSQYAKEISQAAEMKYMVGYADNTFRPENPILYSEAVKILVSLSGYDYLAKMSGEYPVGYINVARDKGFLKGITASANDAQMTAENMVALLYNFIEIDCLEVSGVKSGGITYKTTDGKSLISVTKDIYSGEGIVTANQYTGLSDVKGSVAAGYIQIDNTIYTTDLEIDVNSLLGYRVKFFYIEKDGINRIVDIHKYKNDVLVITSKALDKYENGRIIYRKENGSSASESVNFDTKFVLNGEASTFSDTMLDIDDGTVTLIDTGKGTGYNTVIINSYTYYVVDHTDVANEAIYSKYDNTIIKTKDYSDFAIYDSTHTRTHLATSVEWNVIEALESSNKNAFLATKYDNMTEGKIDAVSIDGKDTTITVDNCVYPVTGYYYNNINFNDGTNVKRPFDVPESGINVQVYLNAQNEIVYIVPSDKTASSIGYLYKKHYNADNDCLTFEIFNGKGEFCTYNASKKMKFNGDKLVGELSAASLPQLDSGDKTDKQLISYKTNAKGEITSIDTALTDSVKNGKLSKIYHSDGELFRATGKYFASLKLAVKKDTVIYYIAPDDWEKRYYSIQDLSFLKGARYKFDAYSTDGNSSVANILVIYQEDYGFGYLSQGMPLTMVNSVKEVVDNYGDIAYELEGIYNNKDVKCTFYDNRIDKTHAISSGDLIVFRRDAFDTLVISKKGSNATGNITNVTTSTNFAYLVDVTDTDKTPKLINTISINSKTTVADMFKAYEYSDGYLKCYDRNVDGASITDQDLLVFNIANTPVYKYDTTINKFVESDYGEIKYYKSSGNSNSYIFVQILNEVVSSIIIYDNMN